MFDMVLNMLLASAFTYLFHEGGPYHIETSPLICRAISYIIGTSVMKELTRRHTTSFQHRYVVVRCRIDAETASCVYRIKSFVFILFTVPNRSRAT